MKQLHGFLNDQGILSSEFHYIFVVHFHVLAFPNLSCGDFDGNHLKREAREKKFAELLEKMDQYQKSLPNSHDLRVDKRADYGRRQGRSKGSDQE